jgi:hypothetical protein
MGSLPTNSQKYLFHQQPISLFRTLVGRAFVATCTYSAVNAPCRFFGPCRAMMEPRGQGIVRHHSAHLDNVMNERLATLIKARERMIEDRDPFAKVLAGPLDRDRSERARTRFVELQNLIEAIERAIRSEQHSAEVAITQPTPQ